MRLTLLGTGSAMPTGERVQAGYLLENGESALLVDCGSGVLHRLPHTAPGYAGIDALLLSHHHLDHVADLLPLLKARWLAGADPLPVYGPPGTETLVQELRDLFAYLATEVEVAATDLDPSEPRIPGWEVSVYETRHAIPCYAYRLRGEAGDLTLSGDTEADPGLAAFADGSRVLVHDCSFPDAVDVANHPTPAGLGEALAGTSVDRVILTHLYPHTRGREAEMRRSIRAHYDGRVEFGQDLARIEC